MWQTAVVLLIVVGVLIFIVRHYAGVFRGEASACSACSDSCCAQQGGQAGRDQCGRPPCPPFPDQEGR